MKAIATRTLQAPQYAPVTMTLEEECTPETFTATLNKLADLIENTLRERYPQYAGVLPQVPKKAEMKSANPLFNGEALHMNNKLKQDKVITIQRGEALVEAIRNCSSLSQLKGYDKFLDSPQADQAYNEQYALLRNQQIAV